MTRRRRRARGHIEELPSGSFRAVVCAGVDPLTGRSRYLRETAKTYDEAEKALTTRKVHYIIRGALERAVRWRYLGVNKAALAEAPSSTPP